jgi:hypothetical protein
MDGNRIFDPNGRGWEGFPKRAFARLDQTAPLDPRESGEAVFVFDAVDAGWSGFASSGDFDLTRPELARERLADFWRMASDTPPGYPLPDPFDQLPIYRIEVTAHAGDRFWDTLLGFTEADWVTLRLTNTKEFPVDVYGAVLAGAVEASLASIEYTSSNESEALDEEFDVDLWPDASDSEIDQALLSIGPVESLVAYDVGQGAALGLLDSSEDVQLYFDLGGGAYGNVKTRPSPLRFCWRVRAPVILSHWDSDHWAGEVSDPIAAQTTWIAPRQYNLGPSHHAFAGRVATKGKLLIWSAPGGTQRRFKLGNATLTLARCTGTGKNNRNGSGIAALMESNTNEAWLLTGDAGYHELGLPLPAQLSAVAVPHHGADMGPKNIPPSRPHGYARLIYSFGPDNTHGRTKVTHPTTAAVNQHINSGWNHGKWMNPPALVVAGGDVLATAENGKGQTAGHLESAASGWSGPPVVPFRTIPCAKNSAATTRCTSNVMQA